VLFISLDEGAGSDTAGCQPCNDTSAGGRIGAVVLSPLVAVGSASAWSGDHYGFLRTLETAWGLPSLKSMAQGADAAAKVHDGDAGVTPLSDVWHATSSAAGATAAGGGALSPPAPPAVQAQQQQRP